MSLRARIAAAFVVFAVPALIAVAYLSWRARHDALVEAVYAATVERMDAGGRERCENDPDRFGLPPLHGGPRGEHRRGHRRRPPFRVERVGAYDASLAPSGARTPPLDPALRASLEAGETTAFTSRGDRTLLAMRMPWSEGPCAVLVVEPPGGPALRAGSLARDLALTLGSLALALVVALVALGPPLRRLARLAETVRRTAAGEALALPGGLDAGEDEIGEVARALRDAGERVRDHVARLEERERAMREYVDGTTHDLAIPLTVLQGRLTDAETAVRSGAPLDRALLASAMAECEYVAQLVANLAAVARLETGHEKIERHAVELGAIVERVAARHAQVAAHHRVTVEHATPAEPLFAIGDDILLERAFSNLVHNAIRHRGEGGGHVAILLERRGARFRLVVKDDGATADAALAERLQRGEDVADPRRARGRGLGLRIVRQVVRAHGFALDFAHHAEGGLEVAIEGETATRTIATPD